MLSVRIIQTNALVQGHSNCFCLNLERTSLSELVSEINIEQHILVIHTESMTEKKEAAMCSNTECASVRAQLIESFQHRQDLIDEVNGLMTTIIREQDESTADRAKWIATHKKLIQSLQESIELRRKLDNVKMIRYDLKLIQNMHECREVNSDEVPFVLNWI